MKLSDIAAAVTITGHETPAVIARRVHRARTDPRSIAAELVRGRMRKAHLKAMVLQVTCPYCGEVVRNPKGEPTWFEDEIKEVIRCAGPYGCQHEMVIPKSAWLTPDDDEKLLRKLLDLPPKAAKR
jgi:hypothetical protein